MKLLTLAISAALAICATGSRAQSAGDVPVWLTKPSSAQLVEAFPDRAKRKLVNGRAAISCTVADDGSMSKCEPVSETPEGYGFGAAALKLARYFKVKPTTTGGSPAAGLVITIPIEFRL